MRCILILLTVGTLGLAQSDTMMTKGLVRDNWWQLDKLKHFTTSFYLTTTSYYFQNRCADLAAPKSERNATLFSLTCGISKEIWDRSRPNGYFSWRDLLCDVMGTAVALAFIRIAT